MHPRPKLTPEQLRAERIKAERANLIVSLAVGDKELAQAVREAYEESERGDVVEWEDVKRQHDL